MEVQAGFGMLINENAFLLLLQECLILQVGLVQVLFVVFVPLNLRVHLLIQLVAKLLFIIQKLTDALFDLFEA